MVLKSKIGQSDRYLLALPALTHSKVDLICARSIAMPSRPVTLWSFESGRQDDVSELLDHLWQEIKDR